MLDLSEQTVAAWASAWPRGVQVTEADVKLAEAGQQIEPLKYQAICWTLNDEGAGVVCVAEASAGGGVRWALNASQRAARLTDRKNRTRPLPRTAHIALLQRDRDYVRSMSWLYGPTFWLRHDVSIPLFRPERAAEREHSRTKNAGIGADRAGA